MTRYRVTGAVMLTFLTERDSYDLILGKDTVLEANHETIYLVEHDGRRRESITTANAIGLWIEQGQIVLDTTARV